VSPLSMSDLRFTVRWSIADIQDVGRQTVKLLATRAKKDTRNYFFSNRVIRAWNILPQSTNFSSLRAFRKSLYGSYLENCCAVCY